MIGFAETLLPYWKPLVVLAAVGAWLAAKRLWPAQVGLVAGWIVRAWRVVRRLFGLTVRLALVVALSVAAAWWASPAVEVDGQTMSRARYAVLYAQEASTWRGICWLGAAKTVGLTLLVMQPLIAVDVVLAWLPPNGQPGWWSLGSEDLYGPAWIDVPKKITLQDRPWAIWWNNALTDWRHVVQGAIPNFERQLGCRIPGGAEAMIQFLGVGP